MEWSHLVILVIAGLGTGFLVGLIGVGGGIIFAPVLFYYYQAVGVPPDVVATLTIATSLFCVLLAASSSAWHQFRRRSAEIRTAFGVGLTSAIGVAVTARLVTTQPWFDAEVFQIIFSVILIVSVVRMLQTSASPDRDALGEGETAVSVPAMTGTGVLAGTLSAVAGVGGGVVLVPIYHNLFHYPIHLATGTSSATIVLTSIFGVITYVIAGWSHDIPAVASVGYVDVVAGATLAIPALLTSRAGVVAAHRLPKRWLTLAFAALAFAVASKLLYDAAFA